MFFLSHTDCRSFFFRCARRFERDVVCVSLWATDVTAFHNLHCRRTVWQFRAYLASIYILLAGRLGSQTLINVDMNWSWLLTLGGGVLQKKLQLRAQFFKKLFSTWKRTSRREAVMSTKPSLLLYHLRQFIILLEYFKNSSLSASKVQFTLLAV